MPVLNLLPALLLWTWSVWGDGLPCVLVILMMLPVLGLITLNMLEVAVMRRRAFVGMYLVQGSALSRLLCRKTLMLIWQLAKALVLTFVLFVESLGWPGWFWGLLLVDVLLISLPVERLNSLLQFQIKPGKAGTLARRMLVSLNTLVLALVLATGQLFEAQDDYRGLGWEETAVSAVQQQDVKCEALAPLANLQAVQEALLQRLVQHAVDSVENAWVKMAGWLSFFFWSGLSLWAWSRMLLGGSMKKQDLDRLTYPGCGDA